MPWWTASASSCTWGPGGQEASRTSTGQPERCRTLARWDCNACTARAGTIAPAVALGAPHGKCWQGRGLRLGHCAWIALSSLDPAQRVVHCRNNAVGSASVRACLPVFDRQRWERC